MNEGKWWTATWNPVTGCSPVSSGCDHCWARSMAKRFRGPDGFKVKFHSNHIHDPFYLKKPHQFFVCNMGDLFYDEVPENFINTVMSIMFNSKQHTFYLLTKRPERMAEYMKNVRGEDRVIENLWLGTSVEDQKTADKRIPILLSIPGFKKFVSVEPMLGPVNVKRWLRDPECTCYEIIGGHQQGCYYYNHSTFPPLLDWIICGAETGPGARPMNLDWARTIRDQCRFASVPFFFKSVGPKIEIPSDLLIREYPGDVK